VRGKGGDGNGEKILGLLQDNTLSFSHSVHRRKIYTAAWVASEKLRLDHIQELATIEAIKAVIQAKNTLIIQPTGSGKSLCFSFPPFVTEKLSTVITPTISLKADHVKTLMEYGISAAHLVGERNILKCSLASSLESTESFLLHQRSFLCNHISILSPWHQSDSMGKIGLLAIDEAHLVMSWSSFKSVL